MADQERFGVDGPQDRGGMAPISCVMVGEGKPRPIPP